ncbi:efflux RND transporter periplasmic adaptor subunit [Spirochaetota bacterium]
MSKKQRIIPIVIVVLAIVVSVLYFEVFRKGSLGDSGIEGSGTIEVTEIEISSKMAGRIKSIPKEEGEKIKRGALAVKLEYDELSAQRNSVIANYRNASSNLTRVKKLFKQGAISKRDYDNALTAYRVAKARSKHINASIDNAVIYSPISGIVLERNLEIGEIAFPGTSIMTIADLTKAWIKIYINEKKLGHIQLGQKAEISVDSFEEKVFQGRVIAISNKAEFTPKTIQTKDERVKLMFAVKIAISNPKMLLKPGMPADARIIMEKQK